MPADYDGRTLAVSRIPARGQRHCNGHPEARLAILPTPPLQGKPRFKQMKWERRCWEPDRRTSSRREESGQAAWILIGI